jgi:hypothetical protein
VPQLRDLTAKGALGAASRSRNNHCRRTSSYLDKHDTTSTNCLDFQLSTSPTSTSKSSSAPRATATSVPRYFSAIQSASNLAASYLQGGRTAIATNDECFRSDLSSHLRGDGPRKVLDCYNDRCLRHHISHRLISCGCGWIHPVWRMVQNEEEEGTKRSAVGGAFA